MLLLGWRTKLDKDDEVRSHGGNDLKIFKINKYVSIIICDIIIYYNFSPNVSNCNLD
jgi:hypothetical protein